MKLRRAASAVLAFAVMVTAVSPLWACAEKKKVTFSVEEDSVSQTQVPALSFDNTDFTKYIHLTRDAEEAGIAFEQEKSDYYQGFSMKVTAKTEGYNGYFSCSEQIRTKQTEGGVEKSVVAYPDAPQFRYKYINEKGKEKTENQIKTMDDQYKIYGFELIAKDFGMTCFDGCFINFTYHLTEADETAFQYGSMWVYGANGKDRRTTNTPREIKFNVTSNDNVHSYRRDGTCTVANGEQATRLIFDLPLSGSVDGAVLYIDNIIVQLPDGKYLKNVDGYNGNAAPRQSSDELVIEQEKVETDFGSLMEEVDKKSGKFSFLSALIILVILALAGGAGYLLFKVIIKFIKGRGY